MRAWIIVLVGAAAPALAQTVYTWVDAEGTTHYTDDRSTVPTGTTAQLTQGEALNWVRSSDIGEDEIDRANASERKKRQAQAAAEALARDPFASARAHREAEQEEARRREEDRWRAAFRAQRDRIATLEDDIARDEAKLEPGGLPLGAGYLCPGTGFVPVGPVATPSLVVSGTGQLAPGVRVGVTGQTWTPVPPGAPLFATPCVFQFNAEVEQVRDRLARNRGVLKREAEALKDLERRAAFEAVPLEWRR